MTPAKAVAKAFENAQVVIAEHVQPGPRNAEKTVERLIETLDDPELYTAIAELLEDELPKLAAI